MYQGSARYLSLSLGKNPSGNIRRRLNTQNAFTGIGVNFHCNRQLKAQGVKLLLAVIKVEVWNDGYMLDRMTFYPFLRTYMPIQKIIILECIIGIGQHFQQDRGDRTLIGLEDISTAIHSSIVALLLSAHGFGNSPYNVSHLRSCDFCPCGKTRRRKELNRSYWHRTTFPLQSMGKEEVTKLSVLRTAADDISGEGIYRDVDI